jgi:hypothetical protein
LKSFTALAQTSGRFEVAEIIARVFPDYKDFVSLVMELFDFPPTEFTFGPYPNDVLNEGLSMTAQLVQRGTAAV